MLVVVIVVSLALFVLISILRRCGSECTVFILSSQVNQLMSIHVYLSWGFTLHSAFAISLLTSSSLCLRSHRMDASVPRSHLFLTGVQHVSLLDCIFMQSRHPRIKSMIVSVFSFTLLGNVVQPCDMEHFGGPFVTYLREDDDYDSFSARLRAISGDNDEDWEKCRLAVVKRKVPHFIKRPVPQENPISAAGVAPTNAATTATTELSLWDSFALKYEAFAKQGRLADIVKHDRTTKDCHNWSYPQLGIQRPVSDVYANRLG